MGHSLKSSLKHILTVDKRDNPILPNYGSFFRLNQEYAGLGGDVGFLKHEIEYQVNQPIGNDFVYSLANYLINPDTKLIFVTFLDSARDNYGWINEESRN